MKKRNMNRKFKCNQTNAHFTPCLSNWLSGLPLPQQLLHPKKKDKDALALNYDVITLSSIGAMLT